MRARPLAPELACLALCAAAALAIPAGCKTSTASGTPGGSTGGGSAADAGSSGARAAAEPGLAAADGATTAAEAARQAAAAASTALDGGVIAAAEPSLTDAQISAVVITANQVDIHAGQAARQRSRNAKVRRFASDMIRDHGAANQQAEALAKKLAITPQETAISKGIAQDGQDNLARLKGLKGKAFDQAYAEHEVVYHQQVVGALDEKLIPAAKDPDLKALLQSVREVVAAHLGHAADLYDSLAR